MKTSIYLGTDDCRLQTGVIIDGRIYGGIGADQIYLGRIHGDDVYRGIGQTEQRIGYIRGNDIFISRGSAAGRCIGSVDEQYVIHGIGCFRECIAHLDADGREALCAGAALLLFYNALTPHTSSGGNHDCIRI